MTDTNQKLREALLSDMDIAVLRMPVHLAFAGNMAQFQYHNRVQALLARIEALALPTAEQVDDINVAESFTSVTKTAAPVGELPELPEPFALSVSVHEGDTPAKTYVECQLFQKHPNEKQKLYTADQMRSYARSALSAAAPVGERERFEAYFAWSRQSKGANRRPNFERFEEDGTYKDDHTQRHWWTWQQALSAGDAVDAQRLDFIEKSARCDPKMDGQHVWWPTSFNTAQLLKGPTLREALDNAIRARKDNT